MIKNRKNYLKILLTIMLMVILTAISTQTFAATLPKVTGLSAKITGENKAYMEWNTVSNAVGYEVYIKTSGGLYSYIGSVTSNNATLVGFKEGVTYKAKVRAYKNVNGMKGYGSYSSEVEIKIPTETTTTTTKLDKVEGLQVIIEDAVARVTWNTVSNAMGYEIYINDAYIGYTYGNAVKILGFTKGNTYTIKVRAFQRVDTQEVYGDYSDELKFEVPDISIEKNEVSVGKVTGLAGKVTGTQVALSWNAVSEATGYEINMVIPGYGSTNMTTTSTSRTVSGLTSYGYSYTTKVRAYKVVNGQKVYGDYSEAIEVYPEAEGPAKVTGLSATVIGTKVRLSWNKVSDATGYELKITNINQGTKTIDTTSTSGTISGLTDTKYYYTAKVRAYKTVNGQKVYGSYSNIVSFKLKESTTTDTTTSSKPAKVTGLAGKVTGTEVALSWNKVSDAAGYEINMVIPGYGSVNMTTTSTSRTVSGLTTYGYSYTTKVRAYKVVDGQKVYGDYSEAIEVYRK